MPLLEIPYLASETKIDTPLDSVRPEDVERSANFFLAYPQWREGILSAYGLAWMYHTIRACRPDHIVEIGTYKGWTTQVLAYAAHANGQGIVHTVGPYDEDNFRPLFEQWPQELQRRVQFYPMNSMAFFQQSYSKGEKFGFVLVDGAHDFEFALSDIQCAARSLEPNGHIFVDNISQVGPYQAAVTFCSQSQWRSWGLALNSTKACDPHRSTLTGTDFAVMQAPPHHIVGSRPTALFYRPWPEPTVAGLSIELASEQGQGTIYIQCALRGFSQRGPQELFSEAQATIDGAIDYRIRFDPPMAVEPSEHYSIEAFAHWDGVGPLHLKCVPTPF